MRAWNSSPISEVMYRDQLRSVTAASWLLLSRDCAVATKLAVAEIEPTLEQKLRWRRNDAFAGELCVRAVDRLRKLVGARELSEDGHFQRAWRDIHAVIQQPVMNWDFSAANFGKVSSACRVPIHDFNQANTVRRAELIGGKGMTRKAGLLKLAMTVAWAAVLFASNPVSATQDLAPSLQRLSSGQPSDLSPYPLVTVNQGNNSSQEGINVRPDAAEAARWYRKAAEQGYAGAQHNLALIYHMGQGVPRDYAKAVKWYRKAAEQGYAGSQHTLGVLYESGEGVLQDAAEAARWYRKAAEQGYAGAQNNLGLLYESGQGVRLDFAEAVNWYRKAADQGVTQAQFNLGVAYAKGLGTVHDLIQAHLWFNLAAKHGLVEAVPLRDFVAESMTPAQIADAEFRASGWLAQYRTAHQGQTTLREPGDAR
jgi:hypothetical protein